MKTKMLQFVGIMLLSLGTHVAWGQSSSEKLLGIVSQNSLEQAPYRSWFQPAFTEFQPDSETIAQLKSVDWAQKTIQIFFGTWCGDSRRELPRFLKLLHTIGIPSNQIQLIAVDNTPNAYKQSPTHEEKGRNIVRVPTMIIYDTTQEMNRIIEYPKVSLEADLLQIMMNESYIPNYADR